MKFAKKIFASPELFCIIAFLVSLFFFTRSQVTVGEVALTRGKVQENTSFPINQKMEKQEHFQVEFVLNNPMGVAYDLQVIPDDCAEKLVVEDTEILLRDIRGHCDYSNGFILTDSIIAPFIKAGQTKFLFEMKNNGGPGGLNLTVLNKASCIQIFNVLNYIFFLSLCFLLLRRLKWKWHLTAILFVGIALRTLFFASNFYTDFAHDVDGHVAYVQYVLEHKAIPSVDDCWTCYHPPVYYVSGAPSFSLAEKLGLSGAVGLQTFSLLLSIVTLILGTLFFKEILSKKGLTVATILWALWPLAILVSPRIGNDQLFYMLHVLCLWGGVKYLNSGRGKFLIVAVMATMLAMWTKTTAVVSLGMLLLFACFGYVGNARLLKPSKSEKVAWLLFAIFLVAVILQKFFGNADLVGNASGLNHKLKIGTEAFNFLYFDLKSFIIHPFTNVWNDEMGRQYFLNYSFKTSLFGEFELLKTLTGRTLATIISVSFLGLCVYAIRGFWKTKMQMIHWLLLLQGIAFMGALAFMRYQYPYACSNDFRYIFPVILSLIPFVSWGINLEGASRKWKMCGVLLTTIFAVSSAILFVLVIVR